MVDFKNTVIIMTTNLGTRDISKGVMTGFQSATDTTTGYERMKGKVKEELRQHFRPEFLNRVDDVIVFPQLQKHEIVQIVDLFVSRLGKRLAEQDLSIELTQSAKDLLADRGYDPAMGARPLRRTIQQMVEDQLSERSFGQIPAGSLITVDTTGEGEGAELTFTFSGGREALEGADLAELEPGAGDPVDADRSA